MVNARSEYKKQFVDMSTENHKQKSWLIIKKYWKLLKHLCLHLVRLKKVTSQQFAAYFKAINDPEGSFLQADKDVL